MDAENVENVEILSDSIADSNAVSYMKVFAKPVRFPEYTLSELEYVLQRYTAIGDFWSCYKKENGPIKLVQEVTRDYKELQKFIIRRIMNP